MELARVWRDRPAGPRGGCWGAGCCPSSPKISLKSSSSFPGQFAVVIGVDRSGGGFKPVARPLEVEALLLKCHIYRPTFVSFFISRAFGHKWTRLFPSVDKSPPPLSPPLPPPGVWVVGPSSSPALYQQKSLSNFQESRAALLVAPSLGGGSLPRVFRAVWRGGGGWSAAERGPKAASVRSLSSVFLFSLRSRSPNFY